MSLQAGKQLLDEFKKLVVAQNDSAESKLVTLKEILLDMDSLPPLCMETPTASQERAFAREVFEYAVIMSVNLQDRDLFQRYISCLKPYYTSFKRDQRSEVTNEVLGLNLLFLLVENRLADFHCELELLSEDENKLPTVQFCVQLDLLLVVGSYDKVMEAAAKPPTKYFSFFLTSLMETVRINIGECAAAAYSTMSIKAATEILMFENEEETLEFISDFYPTWDVDALERTIVCGDGTIIHKSEEIPSLKLISQNLGYATELERIV